MSDQNRPPFPNQPGGPQQNLWPQQQPPHQPQHQGQQPGGQQPQYPGQQPGGQQPQYPGQQPPYHGQQPGYPPQQPGYGQQPYQQGFPAAGQYEQLTFGGEPPQGPKKRGKLIPIVAALAMVLVVAGGGIFAYGKFAGGKQPADVLPGTAVAYARIDLNPSAGQKVNAIRFLMKFPSVKSKLGLTGDKDDLREKLFEQLKKSAGDDLADVDYAKDIKPWLGERAGIAALPGTDGAKPTVVAAIQVKDQSAATKGLDKLMANERTKPGRAFSDGYVLLADDQATVDSAVAAAKNSPLTENAKFKADMDKVGDQGFLSAWADLKSVASLSGKVSSGQLNQAGNATMAAVLRFDPSHVELKGFVHSDQKVQVTTADASDVISKLPDSTAGAIAMSGGDTMIDNAWKSGGDTLKPFTDRLAEETGLSLPDDLKSLLGKNVAVSIDKDTSNGPKIAARMQTDPAKAAPVVEKLTSLLHERTPANVSIETAKSEDTFVVATSKDYAEQVLKGGNLGQSDGFKQALPDTKGAVMIGYVDFEALSSLAKQFASDQDLAALKSAGIVARSTGAGQAEFSLRVVAK